MTRICGGFLSIAARADAGVSPLRMPTRISGNREPHRSRDPLDLDERSLEVLLNVCRQGLEWRHVKHFDARRPFDGQGSSPGPGGLRERLRLQAKGLVRVAAERGFPKCSGIEFVEADKKGREGLARPRRRRDQGVLAPCDRAASLRFGAVKGLRENVPRTNFAPRDERRTAHPSSRARLAARSGPHEREAKQFHRLHDTRPVKIDMLLAMIEPRIVSLVPECHGNHPSTRPRARARRPLACVQFSRRSPIGADPHAPSSRGGWTQEWVSSESPGNLEDSTSDVLDLPGIAVLLPPEVSLKSTTLVVFHNPRRQAHSCVHGSILELSPERAHRTS